MLIEKPRYVNDIAKNSKKKPNKSEIRARELSDIADQIISQHPKLYHVTGNRSKRSHFWHDGYDYLNRCDIELLIENKGIIKQNEINIVYNNLFRRCYRD